MNVLSLFDGMSCGQLALRRAGVAYDYYYASEIDRWAVRVTNHNFPKTIQLGDVKGVKGANLPKIDLLIGGSPCQGFSFAGKELNFKDPRSALFFEYVRILKEVKPRYFLMENTNMKQEYKDVITKTLGVEPITINSRLICAQNRNRIYWTNIPNVTVPKDKEIYLDSIIGKYHGIWSIPRGNNKGGVTHYKRKAPAITNSKGWLYSFKICRNEGDGREKHEKFTLEQIEILQTLPVGYTKAPKVSNTQRQKMIGNGWTVDVIKHIFDFMKNDMEK